jgi:DNA-binding MarR family transcriptional regulator
MVGEAAHRRAGAVRPQPADELLELLPELAVTLYQSSPHRQPEAAAMPAVLTSSQLKVVMHLALYGPHTVSELAQALDVTRASASEMAARLTERGLVVRTADPSDRRIARLALAQPAATWVADVLGERQARVAAAVAAFPELDINLVVAFLKRLMQELKEVPAAGQAEGGEGQPAYAESPAKVGSSATAEAEHPATSVNPQESS